MTTDTLATPWSVTYHDGSGNGFHFRQASEAEGVHFEYAPVTPETSSSGLYSGGQAKQGAVNAEHVEELWQWVFKLESETSLHTPARMMGTGAFNVTTASGARRFMVKNGPLLRAFNTFLLQLRDE